MFAASTVHTVLLVVALIWVACLGVIGALLSQAVEMPEASDLDGFPNATTTDQEVDHA